MVFTSLLLRGGEIFLKGKNYPFFEKKLVSNIRVITGQKEVKALRGRFILPYFLEHGLLKRVFGLTSYSPTLKVAKDFEEIKKNMLILLDGKVGTFKIEPKRSDKTFPLTSPEINVQLGRFVEEHTSLRFDGLHYDHLVGVEINQDGAYLFLEIIPCFGGLPTGAEGNVLLFVDGEESILAGLLMMKRGVNIFPVALEKVDLSLLQKFSPVPLSLKVIHSVSEIDQYALDRQFDILVFGDTFERRSSIKTSLTVLSPLMAFDVEKIERLLKKYETY